MSTPYPPQPPQGPYGQQPPQNPYVQPQTYGLQPAPPYGAPYGQPYPGPWGAPPPPPQKRGGAGLVLGIVGGAVGLVVAVVVGFAVIGSQAEDSFPEAEYELRLSETLLDGKYELAQDLSDSEGRKLEDEMERAWDARETQAAVGQYSLGGDETRGTLVVSGMYGRFKNTASARDAMMEGAAESEGAEVAVKPRDFEPSGAGVTVTCQVLTQSQLGTDVTVPICGWVDGNTGASIAEVTQEIALQKPDEVDLDAFAERILQVRSELRKPIG